MEEDKRFEAEVVDAAATLPAIPQAVPDLFPQIRLAWELEETARQMMTRMKITPPALAFRIPDSKLRVESLGDVLRFGRGPECELSFPDLREISRLHFSITKDECGEYRLTDRGSRNGTFLRGSPERLANRVLVHGDLIDAGGFTFLFVRH